jgi:ATP-dependent RNA helicase DHX8/PRP22
MSELPLEPAFSKVLLSSKDFGCTEEILSIVAMLSIESDSIFFIPKSKKKQAEAAKKRFHSPEGENSQNFLTG